MKCLTCKFWDNRDQWADEHCMGGCRRHAPTSHLIVRTKAECGDSMGHWPMTHGHHWCGDYEAREVAK